MRGCGARLPALVPPPATAIGSRLVASTRTSSASGSMASHSWATASSTCSQLSSTNSTCWRLSAPASNSSTGSPGACRTPSTAATAAGTCA